MKNVSREEIARVRLYAKNVREWAGALNMTHNTLYKYCEQYGIPTNLRINYIPPAPTASLSQLSSSIQASESSSSPSSTTKWSGKLTGIDDKPVDDFVPLYVVGHDNKSAVNNARVTPQAPGNPLVRNPNLGLGFIKKHTI